MPTNHSACVSQTVADNRRLLGRRQRAPLLTGMSVARRAGSFFDSCAASPNPSFSRVRWGETSGHFPCSLQPHRGRVRTWGADLCYERRCACQSLTPDEDLSLSFMTLHSTKISLRKGQNREGTASAHVTCRHGRDSYRIYSQQSHTSSEWRRSKLTLGRLTPVFFCHDPQPVFSELHLSLREWNLKHIISGLKVIAINNE